MSNDAMFSQVSPIAAQLGWQFHVVNAPAQLIAFPEDRSLLLRFSLTDEPHAAIVVELIEENGIAVATPPGLPIVLLDFCLDTDTAVRQLKSALIEPYPARLRSSVSAHRLAPIHRPSPSRP